MTVAQDGTGALIDDARQWHAIDWKRAQREVRRLQMRIAKAVKENKPGKSMCSLSSRKSRARHAFTRWSEQNQMALSAMLK